MTRCGRRSEAVWYRAMSIPLKSALCRRCYNVVLGLAYDPWTLDVSAMALKEGFSNRSALARHLARHGLPPFSTLRDWHRLIHLVVEWETRGRAAMRTTWAHAIDPATGYRISRRLLGQTWSRARGDGSTSLRRRFSELLTLSASCAQAMDRCTKRLNGMILLERAPVTLLECSGRGSSEPMVRGA